MPASFADTPGVTWYLYLSQVALDDNGALVRNASGYVYASATSSTPLQIRDLNGTYMNMVTDSLGLTPSFYAAPPSGNADAVLVDLGVRRIGVGSADVPGLVGKVNQAVAAAQAAADSAAAAVNAAQGVGLTDGSVTNAKVAVNAAISADKIADSGTRVLFTPTERQRLADLSGAPAPTTTTDPVGTVTLRSGRAFIVVDAVVNQLNVPPNDPTLTATGQTGQVALSWSGGTGTGALTSQAVLRSTTSGGVFTAVSPAPAANVTTYADTSVTNGTQYFYKVTRTNPYGTGTSNVAAATPTATATPPGTPTLTATGQPGQVALSWTGSTGSSALTAQTLLRSATQTGTFTAITPGPSATATSYVDTTATDVAGYWYRITRTNVTGSATSIAVNAVPTAPPADQTIDDTVIGTGTNQFDYKGAWATSSDPAKYGGSDHYTSIAGDSVTLRFEGTQVVLYGAKASHHGQATVSIDGAAPVTVDQNSATRQDNVEFFRSGVMGYGPHQLTLINGSAVIALDRAVVSGSSAPVPAPGPAPTPTPTPSPTGSSFVTRSGMNLMVNGQKVKFFGYNTNGFPHIHCGGGPDNHTDVDAYFSRFTNSHTWIRAWCLPGNSLTEFDYIISKAKATGARIIPCLADANGFCGETGGSHGSSWLTGGWRSTHQSHFETMANRYKNEPTVAFWELCNEANGNPGDLANFAGAAAAVIKNIDPNHLICAGTSASYSCGGAAGYKQVYSAAGIDICTTHDYQNATDGGNYGWIDTDAGLAQELNKPLWVGEIGCNASSGDWPRRRDKVIGKMQSAFGRPSVCGATYWAVNWNIDGIMNTGPADPYLLPAIRDFSAFGA